MSVKGVFKQESQCALCLYSLGWGCKRVAKHIGTSNHVRVYQWVKAAGMLNPQKRSESRYAAMRAVASERVKEKQRQAEERRAQRVLRKNTPKTEEQKEVARLKARQWYAENRETVLQRHSKRWHEKLKHDPSYRLKRQEELNRWKLANKDKVAAYNRLSQKRWKQNNPEAYRAARKKARSTPKRKLVSNLRRRLRGAIRGQKKYSIGATVSLIGCTSEQLRAHIESQWLRGMSWDNYGEWHVDHIIPCAAFDLTDKQKARQCFHYTNLQPLWAEDNMKKSATIAQPVQPELVMVLV